ncbi:Hsp20/alpha crystallin family protein [Chitinophaga sedimenti]|uniref:Hsp20/alpha crystallin family protein n=1 Tax=Chitinophaga sedimenti TaxID=2033606 RepID=UPI0035575DB9
MFENDGFFRRTITTPAVNVTDKPDAYQLSVAAPGLKKDDFNIDVDGNMLTISCEKKNRQKNMTKNTHVPNIATIPLAGVSPCRTKCSRKILKHPIQMAC